MKYILAFISLMSFYTGFTQKPDNRLSMGIIDSIYSPTLNEYRKLWIYTPDGYKRDKKLLFPVVYLLDGDGHFYSVAGMIQQLSEINGNTVCPEWCRCYSQYRPRARSDAHACTECGVRAL